MEYRPYERIEQQILGNDTGSIHYRLKWGHLVLIAPGNTLPSGRLKKGVLEELVEKARAHGYKLSRAEAQRRVQAARTYWSEPQTASVLRQFDSWWSLISAGFPAIEAPEDAEPYDPRAPHKKRNDARREFNRITNSPEAHGQDPLPGLRTYLPGFSPDTVGREIVFREAFKIHAYICEEATPQLGRAYKQALSDDQERGAKLSQLFDAIGRNESATLGEGDDAFWAERDASAPDE